MRAQRRSAGRRSRLRGLHAAQPRRGDQGDPGKAPEPKLQRGRQKTPEVRAVVAYEPGSGFVFPQDEVPPPMPSAGGTLGAVGVPLAEFLKLTKIPVILFYGDILVGRYLLNPLFGLLASARTREGHDRGCLAGGAGRRACDGAWRPVNGDAGLDMEALRDDAEQILKTAANDLRTGQSSG